MSSIDQETTEVNSFKNAFPLTFNTPTGNILDITIEAQPKKNIPEVRIPVSIRRNEQDTPELAIWDTDNTIGQEDFSEIIRENVFPLTHLHIKEEKQDICNVTQILDTLHKFAPCITFDFIQRMVTSNNGMFKENYLSLLTKYGNPIQNNNSKLIFFYDEEKDRAIALGIWKDCDDEMTERSGYVWNFNVPLGQALAVQNKLSHDLAPLYKSFGFKIYPVFKNKDLILNFSRKHFKYSIALHTELSCGC